MTLPLLSDTMDIKHEMIYRDDDVLLVKSEPQLYSPTNDVANLLSAALPNAGSTLLATTSAIPVSNGLTTIGSFNSFCNVVSVGSTVTVAGSTVGVSPQSAKRPRTEDFLSSPSPGNVSVSVPPLTPSPGPPSQAYTVISNGYSSPMSSGSYDPYSPNGKISKLVV